jgi:hypothetical protein
VASATGTHTFRGLANDAFAVYISNTTHNSTTTLTTALISVGSAMPYRSDFSNWYQSDWGTSAEQSLDLVAYNRYYMEVYHMNNNGDGWFELGIEVPNTDATIEKWQSYEVQKIETAFTRDPEIIVYNISNAGTGDITYKYNEKTNDNGVWKIVYDQNATTSFDASAADFCTAIASLRPFSGYNPSCTLIMYDNDNMVTTDSAIATVFQYTVTVWSVRSADRYNEKITLTGATLV